MLHYRLQLFWLAAERATALTLPLKSEYQVGDGASRAHASSLSDAGRAVVLKAGLCTTVAMLAATCPVAHPS